jgi:hypothetical protein
VPGAPLDAGQRAAVPLASTGNVFVSAAWADRVSIIDLASGTRTDLASTNRRSARGRGVAGRPLGRRRRRWPLPGRFNFDGRALGVYDLVEKRLARVIDLGDYRGPHDLVFVSPDRLIVTV